MLIPVAVVNEVTATPPPTSPVGTPAAWYDASDVGSVTTVSDAVSQWDDQMGSFNATQGTAGDRPLYGGAGARSINGIVCLEFVSNDFLISSCPRDDVTSTTFVVGVTDANNANRAMVGCQGGSLGIQFRHTTVGQLETFTESGTSAGVQSNAAMTNGVAFVAVSQLTAVGVTQWLAASAGITVSSETDVGALSPTAGRTTRIGTGNTGAGSWDGLMGEIIIYDSTLSNDDVLLNMSYLKNKWAILDVS